MSFRSEQNNNGRIIVNNPIHRKLKNLLETQAAVFGLEVDGDADPIILTNTNIVNWNALYVQANHAVKVMVKADRLKASALFKAIALKAGVTLIEPA